LSRHPTYEDYLLHQPSKLLYEGHISYDGGQDLNRREDVDALKRSAKDDGMIPGVHGRGMMTS